MKKILYVYRIGLERNWNMKKQRQLYFMERGREIEVSEEEKEKNFGSTKNYWNVGQ